MTAVEIANVGWGTFCILIWLCHWLFENTKMLTRTYDIVAMLSSATFFLSAYFTISFAWNGEWNDILSIWVPLVIFPVFLFTDNEKPRPSRLIGAASIILILIGCGLGTVLYSSERDASYGELLAGAFDLDGTLHEPPLPPSVAPILNRGHFVILQSERNRPQALHYTGNHGFPVPASPSDVQQIIVVVRHTVSLGPPAGGQRVFDCTAFDVRSKRALASSTVAGDTGSYQALGGVSSRGQQPWRDVEQWVSTLILQ